MDADPVTVQVGGGRIRIHRAGVEVACHDRRLDRRERAVERAHLQGIVPPRRGPVRDRDLEAASPGRRASLDLLRPLAEFERIAGGGW